MQRDGGTHRPGPRSIGKGSAAAKRKLWLARLRNLAIAVVTIWIGAGIAGAMFSGIGFWGLMAVVVTTCLAVGLFSSFPKIKVPQRAELTQGNPQQMVARTELWLEAQRPALPPPAQTIVDQLGVQLDALGLQLQGLDGAHPAMAEVRELVGEYIPETIDNYRKIPVALRKEEHAGKTADQRLTESSGSFRARWTASPGGWPKARLMIWRSRAATSNTAMAGPRRSKTSPRVERCRLPACRCPISPPRPPSRSAEPCV